jgi:thiol-disulfide isomerase/thioredoxin
MNTRHILGGLRVAALLLALLPAMNASAVPPAWEKLLGQRAAEWRLEHWLNSKPLRLEDLRGKVVLVRWWTAPQCPYCGATAPALNEFRKDYGEQGTGRPVCASSAIRL